MMSRFGKIYGVFLATLGYCLCPAGVDVERMGLVRPWMITVWGLGYGLILLGVYSASWKFFGDIYFSEYSRLKIVPIAMVVLVTSVVGFKQVLGLAVTVDRLATGGSFDTSGDSIPSIRLPGLLAVLLAVLLKFSALLAMPYHTPWWPGDWRRVFNPLYPLMHSRVLILLGLWGKAGLLVAGATGSTHPAIDAADRQFRRNLTIRNLAGNLLFTFLVTTVYFSSWRNRAIGILVSFVIFLLVYLISMGLSWRAKGQNRYTIFACAEVAEILLLFSYLAISRFL